MTDRYPELFDLTVRLLRGEIIERVERGHVVRATASLLIISVLSTGERTLVVDGDAYEVALMFAAQKLAP